MAGHGCIWMGMRGHAWMCMSMRCMHACIHAWMDGWMEGWSDLQGSAANDLAGQPPPHVIASHPPVGFKAPDWPPDTSSHELPKAHTGAKALKRDRCGSLSKTTSEVPVVHHSSIPQKRIAA